MARRNVSAVERRRIAAELERAAVASEREAQRIVAALYESLKGVKPEEVAAAFEAALPQYSAQVARGLAGAFARAERIGARAASRQLSDFRPGWERAAEGVMAQPLRVRALGEVGSIDALSPHIWRQGRAVVARLKRSMDIALREGEHALEIARRLRDEAGIRAWVSQPKAAQELWDSARRMVTAGTADPRALRQFAALRAKLERQIATLSKTAGEFGMRAAQQHAVGQLTKALKAGNVEAVERAKRWWLYDKQAYEMRAYARTQTGYSYTEAFKAEADEPWVVGFKWNVESIPGRVRDICDVYGGQNLYGLGPGVYPFGKEPTCPAHTNCNCYLTEVIDERVDEGDERPAAPPARAGADAAWLRSQPASVQREILGAGGYETWRRGGREFVPPRIRAGEASVLRGAVRGPSYAEASAR